MRSPSRRDVLKIAGAAGVAPLLGAGPLHRHRRTHVCCEPVVTDFARVTCDLYVYENLTIYINGVAKTGASGGTNFPTPVAYTPSDPTHCYLPWAPDHLLTVPATVDSQTFYRHRFELRLMNVASTLDYYVQAKCIPIYKDSTGKEFPKTIACCFKCGAQEVCVAPNNCIMCGGFQMCCSQSYGPGAASRPTRMP